MGSKRKRNTCNRRHQAAHADACRSVDADAVNKDEPCSTELLQSDQELCNLPGSAPLQPSAEARIARTPGDATSVAGLRRWKSAGENAGPVEIQGKSHVQGRPMPARVHRGRGGVDISNSSGVNLFGASAKCMRRHIAEETPAFGDSETWLERVRKQVEFYFGDANLRRDAFMQRKLQQGHGYVKLSTILQFNRIKALKCRFPAQLAQALRKSDMLELSEEKTKVRRDATKAPAEETDIAMIAKRTIYIEGLPLTFNIDDVSKYIARYGRVRLVDLPRHRETREPCGFCFIEFASQEEAMAAMSALHGSWPSAWQARYDGKTLRVMSKAQWLDHKHGYAELHHAARSDSPSRIDKDFPTSLATTSKPRIEQQNAAMPGEPKSLPLAMPAASSDAPLQQPPSSEAEVSEAMGTKEGIPRACGMPRASHGCLLRISNFSMPQTSLSIRQFAEHAVPVLYCDFRCSGTGSPVAHLRLKCPSDCLLLAEDLRRTHRMLGWLRPEVQILAPEEEIIYWEEVAGIQAARAIPAAAGSHDVVSTPRSKKARRRSAQEFRFKSPQLHGAFFRGDAAKATVHLWPLPPYAGALNDLARRSDRTAAAVPRWSSRGGAVASNFQSFVDTVGGNGGFRQAGFGRPRRTRRRGRRKAADEQQAFEAVAAAAGTPAASDAPGAGAGCAVASGPAELGAATSTSHFAVAQPSKRQAGDATGLERRGKVPRSSRAGGDGVSRPQSPCPPGSPFPPPSPFIGPGGISGAKAKRKIAPPRTPALAPRTPVPVPPRTPGGRSKGSGPAAPSELPPPSPVARPQGLTTNLPSSPHRGARRDGKDSASMVPSPDVSALYGGVSCGGMNSSAGTVEEVASAEVCTLKADAVRGDTMLDNVDDILGLMDE